MEKYVRDWSALTPFEQEQAVYNYADILINEGGGAYSEEIARLLAPFCRGWWVDTRYGYVTCNI